MLLASQFDLLVEPIVALFQEFEESVIRDIARRLAGMDYATPTAAWQVQRLSESGMLYERILRELSKVTGRSQYELRRMFQRAGVTAMRFDDAIYRAVGLQPVPLNLSPAMGEVLAAGLRKTGGIMQNLTMTTALSGQQAFESAADLAYMQISSGAFSYQQAIRQAVKRVAADGLDVIHFAGRTDKLDVAMRRTVLTGVGQTVAELSLARADEMGTDLIQVSAHIGARNKGEGPMNHESWQGKVYSRSGDPKYPDFVTVTGYGTGEGLGGWNCRHSAYPFFEGISAEHYTQAELDDYAAKTVTYQGKEMSVYEATQEQRYIERKIRYWKRQANALEAAGLENDTETARVREWQAQMRDFIGQTGLQRQRNREFVVPDVSHKVEPQFFDWEVRELRQVTTSSFEMFDKDPYKTVLVPKNVHEKLLEIHSDDAEYLSRFGELISSWEYAGWSPKGLQKIEFYKELDNIWFTLVVKKDKQLQAYILTTFHRIYRRKMENRIAKGYLLSRK